MVKAAQDVTFEVPEGKLFTLLGPSGCGKTTTLRSIAGLEKPTSGEIEVAGQRGLFVEPRRLRRAQQAQFRHGVPVLRDLAAHERVPERRVPAGGAQARASARSSEKVMRVLTAVQLDHLVERDATKLSGGQQQRLALARALVMEPQLLLLDEPLSNLDAKLRDAMRTELKRLQREFNLTTVYVTHDQTEALSLSHEIAVMNDGFIVQIGTPRADLRAAHQPVRRRFRRPDQFRRRHRDRGRRRRPLPGQDRARRAEGPGRRRASPGMPRWWYRCARRTWSCPSRNSGPAPTTMSSGPPCMPRISLANIWIFTSRWAMLCCKRGRTPRCAPRPETRSLCACARRNASPSGPMPPRAARSGASEMKR